MTPMTVADLRNALATLPDDQQVVDAASGLTLVDADPTSTDVELLFLDVPRRSRRGAVVNSVSGTVTGSLMQVGGAHHGDIHL